VVRAHRRPESGDPFHPGRRLRADAFLHRRRRPCIFVENLPNLRAAPSAAPERGKRVPLGKANVLRSGKDVTVISYSRQVHDAAAVADKLARENISVEVIDLRTSRRWTCRRCSNRWARPAARWSCMNGKEFRRGREIASRLNEELFGKLKSPVRRLGGAFCPVPFSKPLETAFVPGSRTSRRPSASCWAESPLPARALLTSPTE